MELLYRKIGAVVYAVNRLGAVIDQIEHHFSSMDQSSLSTYSAQKVRFASIVSTFQTQENSKDYVSSPTDAELDGHLKQLQQIHLSLAEILDEIGLQDISSEGLRAQGRTLTIRQE